MSTAALRRRLKRLEGEATRSPEEHEVADFDSRFQAAVSPPGTWARLHQIAEHGASPDDLEWLERQTKETGVDFPEVVETLVRLEEEY